MKGLSTQERLNDICRISGISENVVRRVLDAERESIANSLKRGERATLIGRCVIRPEIRSKIEIGGIQRNYIKLSAQVTNSMESMMDGLSACESDREEVTSDNGIRLRQISALE